MLTESETNISYGSQSVRTPVQRVEVSKILGVTVTNSLSVSPHVQTAIAPCAQALYALVFCVLMVYVYSALQTIYRAVVVAKLMRLALE